MLACSVPLATASGRAGERESGRAGERASGRGRACRGGAAATWGSGVEVSLWAGCGAGSQGGARGQGRERSARYASCDDGSSSGSSVMIDLYLRG